MMQASELDPRGIVDREPQPRKIADIFPGQGFDPEKLAEAASSLRSSTKARDVFVVADEVLGRVFPGNRDFSRIMFSANPSHRVDLTSPEYAQPAMLAVSMASLGAFEELGGEFGKQKPEAVAGHSAGTVISLVRAGVLDLEIGMRVARKRGEAMKWSLTNRSDRGTMVAVLGTNPINEDELKRLCEDQGVVLANINSPTVMLISGSIAGTKRVAERVKEMGFRAIETSLGAAYHNPNYMGPAVARFRREIQYVKFKDPKVPFYLNSTGQPVNTGEEIKKALPEDIQNPVRWKLTIENMRRAGIEVFREFGGSTLTGWLQRIDTIPKSNSISIDSVEAAKKNYLFNNA